MSEAWDRFIYSLEEMYPGQRDRDWGIRLDTEAIQELRGEERERALAILLDRLKIESGIRIPGGLAAIGGERAVAALDEKLQVARRDGERIAIAEALWRLSRSATAKEIIEEGLESPDPLVAGSALDALEHLGREGIQPALKAAALHSDANIRYGGAMCALFLGGVNRSAGSWEHRPLVIGIASEDLPERQRAFAALCELLGISDSYTGPRPG